MQWSISFIKLVTWIVVWVLLWFPFLLFRKGRDNCLTWALRKWEAEGGYLVIRWCRSSKSSWFVWPHFLWMSDEHEKNVVHLVPTKKEQREQCHRIPRPWFNGAVVKGDKNPYEN